jgi:hypothetical protein
MIFSPDSPAEFVQQLFLRDKIGGAETLRESLGDRLEAGDGDGEADRANATSPCNRPQAPGR